MSNVREHMPEPWLRGALSDVSPLLMPVLHALMQAREDLRRHTDGLDDLQVWIRPNDLTPLGFHLRHIAGSLDRLTSYLQGRLLGGDQLAFLGAESNSGASLCKLLDDIDTAIEAASEVIRSLDVTKLVEARAVGRKKLPTTVMGLAVHIAEHTQRHVGQAITMCSLLKNTPEKQ